MWCIRLFREKRSIHDTSGCTEAQFLEIRAIRWCHDSGLAARIQTNILKTLIKVCKKCIPFIVQAKRADALSVFKTDADTSVFLVSLRSGGVGLNLTAASRKYTIHSSAAHDTRCLSIGSVVEP
jgi:hypothetical protein